MAKKEESTNIVTFETALSISSILSGCTIKSLGSDLFFPIIKLNANLSGVRKKYTELCEAIHKELGIVQNQDNTVSLTECKGSPNEVLNKAKEAFDSLLKDDSDIKPEHIKLFNEQNLQDLFSENPTLKIAELEILMQLVK